VASVLNIDGVAADFTDPDLALRLDSLTLNIDEADILEFSQVSVLPWGDFEPGQDVELTLEGWTRPVFKGKIVAPSFQNQSEQGWSVGYRALGLRYWVNLIAVTGADYDTTIVFNRRPIEGFLYSSLEAGKTVGQMMKRVLDVHAEALEAAGIGGRDIEDVYTSYVESDFDAMDVIPPQPVPIAGRNLLNAIDMTLQRWQGRYVCRIQWDETTEDWRLRFVDPHEYPSETLTFGVDPIDPNSFRCEPDTTPCYSRVVIRGQAKIEAADLSTRLGTLVPAWDEDLEEDWRWADFASPDGMLSEGSIVADTLSTLGCQVTSLSATETWPENYWASKDAYITLIYPLGNTNDPAGSFSEIRKITSNSALTAGGQSTISWSSDIEIVGESYTRYSILGTNSERSLVYREYDIVPEYVKNHLASQFPRPVPFGSSTTLIHTSFPIAQVEWGANPDNYDPLDDVPVFSGPYQFELDRENGRIRFFKPTVWLCNAMSVLESGGEAVVPPFNVRVLLPYAVGTLEAAWPQDDTTGSEPVEVHEGTLHDWYPDLDRTLYVDFVEWRDPRQIEQYEKWAKVLHDSMKDVIVDGSVLYHGRCDWAMELANRVNFDVDEGYDPPVDLGFSAIQAPIRTVNLQWHHSGGSHHWTTTIVFNNRRQVASGEQVYIHPAFQSTFQTMWGMDNFFIAGTPGTGGSGPRMGMPTGMMPTTSTPTLAGRMNAGQNPLAGNVMGNLAGMANSGVPMGPMGRGSRPTEDTPPNTERRPRLADNRDLFPSVRLGQPLSADEIKSRHPSHPGPQRPAPRKSEFQPLTAQDIRERHPSHPGPQRPPPQKKPFEPLTAEDIKSRHPSHPGPPRATPQKTPFEPLTIDEIKSRHPSHPGPIQTQSTMAHPNPAATLGNNQAGIIISRPAVRGNGDRMSDEERRKRMGLA
jgi:hypothetical protein